jgi:aspartyl-tRNA(Asn)/glutamyl-tRNA(Gln) amidotransferase subunit B
METRGFDLESMETFSLREKEETNEYYFMQDANIPPVVVTAEYVESIRRQMPEELDIRRNRLVYDYGLDVDTVDILMGRQFAVEYFEKVLNLVPKLAPKKIANWIVIELFGYLNKHVLNIDQSPVESTRMAALLKLLSEERISQLQAKHVLGAMMADEREPIIIAKERGILMDVDDTELHVLCRQVIQEHPDVVEKIVQKGKDKLVGFLIGQVMQRKKSANPKLVAQLIKDELIKQSL